MNPNFQKTTQSFDNDKVDVNTEDIGDNDDGWDNSGWDDGSQETTQNHFEAQKQNDDWSSGWQDDSFG